MTVGDMLDIWLFSKQREIKPSTVDDYRRYIHNIKQSDFGNSDAEEITTMDIDKYITNRCKYSYNVARGETKVLRPAFFYGTQRGLIQHNPYTNIKALKEIPKIAIEIYKDEEVQALIACANKEWKQFIIELAYRTGMRIGELLGLAKDCINWTHGFISVERNSVFANGKHYFDSPKTFYSKRRIDVDDYTMDILERLCWKKEKFLFDNGRGSVYRSNSVQIKQICKKANIRERRFHDLRHTHAATLLMNGVHPKIVQERLGHSQMEFTLRVYSQFLPTIQEAAVKVYQDIPSCSTISLETSRVV